MPHVPNPLGSFPLTLRDYNIKNPRRGELLLDYTTYDLYYINKHTGQMVAVAKDIYDRIMAAKLQNTTINIKDADKQDPIPGRNEIWPPVSERKYNNFYYIVRGRTEFTRIEGGEEPDAPNPDVFGITGYGDTIISRIKTADLRETSDGIYTMVGYPEFYGIESGDGNDDMKLIIKNREMTDEEMEQL